MSQTVLVNPNSGLAESFEDPAMVQQKISAGYHVPLHDAQGNAVSAPHSEAQELVQSGQYRQPTPDELNSWMTAAKFQSPSEQAKTFIEGAAEGLSGPVAPAIERMLGVPGENIALRQTLNPKMHFAGQATSMGLATAASGGLFGEAAAARAATTLPSVISAGAKAAASGIELTGSFGNVARAMTSGAIEGAAYTASHKLSESLIGDPHNFAEHLVSDIGISALVGGAIGGAAELGLGPLTKLSKATDRAAKFIDEHLPESETTFAKGAFRNFPPKPGTPLYQTSFKKPAPAFDTIKKTFEEATEPTKENFVNLLKNAPGYVASRVSKAAGKWTIPMIAKAFPEEAQKAVAMMETFKIGVNTLSKIEKQSAGLFGYGAFELMRPPPDASKLDAIYERINDIQVDPGIFIDKLRKHTEPMAEAMPDTTVALAKTVGNATQYLAAKRPDLTKQAPLDMDKVPTRHDIANFNQAANIIDNPLGILQHIKEGSVNDEHIRALQTVYPTLLQSIQKETMKNLMRYQSEDKPPLEYKMRLGLSKLLGQPLDSSLLSLSKNQLALGGMQMAQQTQQRPAGKASKSGISKMKTATREKTRAQQSVERRVSA